MHLDCVFSILGDDCCLMLDEMMGPESPTRRLVDEWTRLPGARTLGTPTILPDLCVCGWQGPPRLLVTPLHAWCLVCQVEFSSRLSPSMLTTVVRCVRAPLGYSVSKPCGKLFTPVCACW